MAGLLDRIFIQGQAANLEILLDLKASLLVLEEAAVEVVVPVEVQLQD